MIRRLLITAAALLTIGAAAALPAAMPAGAQTGPGYGGGGCTVTITPSTLVPGQSFTVTLAGCAVNGTFTITFNSTPIVLGHLTTNSAGAASGSFQVPSSVAPGAHTVQVLNPSGTPVASAAVTVVSGTPGSTAPASTGSGLAFTGAEIAFMTAGAAALLAVGGLIVLSTRRRNEHA